MPHLRTPERVAPPVSAPAGFRGAGVVYVSDRVSCKSDLSEERWTLIEPVLTARKAAHPSVSGHQGRYELREIVTAILYQNRTELSAALRADDLEWPENA
jgi:hypothetical protein